MATGLSSIALGAVDENLRDHEVFSYEGPFGVGYWWLCCLMRGKSDLFSIFYWM